MIKNLMLRILMVLSALVAITPLISNHLHAGLVTAKKTDDFVDSMGLNIKLDRSEYNNNWSSIKPRLQELGIWHYRDGLKNVNNSSTYRSRYQSLYNESGMRGLFIWGPWENQNRSGPGAVGAAKKGLDYVFIISGPNEPDLFWPTNYDGNSSTDKWREIFDYQNAMYSALKADSATDHIPVTTPPVSYYGEASLIGNNGTVLCDKIAWHWYSGQGHPDKNEVSTGISQAKSGLDKSGSPTSDMYTTESGHNSWKTANPGNTNGSAVSERTQMRYNLRILADQYRRGIYRTYLHQLMDLGTSPTFNNSWGIVKADSGKTPKPAFTAWKEIVSLFKERTWNSGSKTWSKPSYTPGSLDYTITGNTDSVKSLLLQKSNGTFYLMVWVARPSWSSSSDTDTSVFRSINVDFAQAQTVKRFRFSDTTGLMYESSATSSNGSKRWTFDASDSMSILEITGGSGGSGGLTIGHYYNIRSKHDGLYLRAYDETDTPNSGVNSHPTMFNQPTWLTQKWKLVDAGGGLYNLQSAYDTTLYLRGYDANGSGPGEINDWATLSNNPTYQTHKWSITPTSTSGYYNIRCDYSGPDGKLYLRGYDETSTPVDGINTYPTMYNQPTYGTQQWEFVDLGTSP